MVQLSDDNVHGPMLSLAQAREELAKLALGLAPKHQECDLLPVEKSMDRIAGDDVIAQRHVPLADNSAVDGFAFRHNDLASDLDTTSLPLQPGAVLAGQETNMALKLGHALAITTGASIPPGADSVCMLEDAIENPGKQTVAIPSALKRGSNLRPKGEDLTGGEVIVARGMRITARHVAAMLASGSNARISLVQRPRVLVASTGDELDQAGQGEEREQAGLEKHAATVIDSNGPMLTGLLRDRWLFDAGLHPQPLPDDLTAVTDFFASNAARYQVILTSGAVSTGQKDYLKQGFEAAGGSVAFWRIGIKPGRPVAVGTLGNCLWIGLPGNPVAALVTALEVALPTLRATGGEIGPLSLPGYWVEMTSPYKKKAGRLEFVRVRVESDPAATKGQLPKATKFHKTGAGMISGLTWSDGLAAIPPDVTQLAPGTAVWFTPWESYRL